MKRFLLKLYLLWLESHIDMRVYDYELSLKIDRVFDRLGE